MVKEPYPLYIGRPTSIDFGDSSLSEEIDLEDQVPALVDREPARLIDEDLTPGSIDQDPRLLCRPAWLGERLTCISYGDPPAGEETSLTGIVGSRAPHNS